MPRVTDYQRQRVYNWENQIIGKFDTTKISLEDAQDLINFVWATEGFNHPPKIEMSNRKKGGADATRTTLRFTEESMYRWIVIHELAHAFEAIKGYTDGHGKRFVTRYIDLLEKHLRIPKMMLWYTLKEASIDFNMKA